MSSDVVVAVVQPARAPLAARIYGVAFLLIAPPAAYWLLQFQPIAQDAYLDPYFYTGYITNFQDLFARYGATYYGVRFGFILPARLAAYLFGPISGFFALRYALALTAGVPFYFLVRQWYGLGVARAMYLLLMTSPYLARTLLWDYTNATGVPFLFAAVALTLLEHRRRYLLDAAAGALAALAVNSNIFILVPLLLYLAPYAVLWVTVGRGINVLFKRIACALVAALLVTALGAAYYFVEVGRWEIFSPTFNITNVLANGGMRTWRKPGFAWVVEDWTVLSPVVLAVLAIVAGGFRRPTAPAAAVWLGSVAVIAFFYAYQFLLDGNILQLFYYFSYMLPACFLLLALIVAAIWSRAEVHPPATALLLASAAGPWLLYSVGFAGIVAFTLPAYLATALLAAAILAVGGTTTWRRPLALASTAVVGFTVFASFSAPTYAKMLNSRVNPSTRELDVYATTVAFIQQMPKHAREPGAIRFWYQSSEASLSSVQSTFLWGFSRIQEGAGMPESTPGDQERLRDPSFRWLVLLSENDATIDAGLAALRNLRIDFRVVRRLTIRHGSYTLHIGQLELRQR